MTSPQFMGVVITIVLTLGAAFAILESATMINAYATGANGGTNGGTGGGGGKVTVNCDHSPRSGLSNCKKKTADAGSIIIANTTQGNATQSNITNDGGLATLNLTDATLNNTDPAGNVTDLVANTTLPTNAGVRTLNPGLDMVELECDYDPSASRVYTCIVRAVIQIDPDQKDRLRIIESPTGTLNMTAQLPFNTTTLGPLQ